ncbi:MAG: trypsin-like peptidase domain-containing protein [Syntrophothermus sp.]|uniref:trypsin-like peptidase domain-containing protein n=1 Tax=Syntrophothermus sp. TaxID=2736299 RepID=UPI002579F9F7|nr:trypsin-like peptidase domain-containing protein [Syntrophothermus sp.]NSW82202.1 trypsin-like peptidase domain-containing protein [Syntrophothermus sp.]
MRGGSWAVHGQQGAIQQREVHQMITPTMFTEQLVFTTVRIETTLKDGNTGVGTGFFFNMKVDDNRTLPLIVTSKHVAKDTTKGRFQLHEALPGASPPKPSGQFFTVELDNFESQWIPHPDPAVDLCAMPFQPLRARAEVAGKAIFNVSFHEGLILSGKQLEELSAVEDILFVGYPTGLWDEKNNLPLIRRGVTASHPALDFGGRPVFVIDAACFPGSSGSPVLLANLGSYYTKDGSLVVGTRVALLGVLYAGPEMTVEGSIVARPIPTTVLPASITRVMIHLGYVIKAKEIVTLGSHVILEAENRGWL